MQVEEAKKLGLTEVEHAKREFKKLDLNHDGLLTKKEFLTYFGY